MFKRGQRTKILLVVDKSTIYSTRGERLADIAVKLKELFPQDFKNLIHSIMIVVSKVGSDLEEEDVI